MSNLEKYIVRPSRVPTADGTQIYELIRLGGNIDSVVAPYTDRAVAENLARELNAAVEYEAY
jgi:hypothetical protein